MVDDKPKITLRLMGKKTLYKVEVIVEDGLPNHEQQPMTQDQRKGVAKAILDFIDGVDQA